ncbi:MULTISPECIES: alpha/beta hydrolase [unclassified Rhizobium]|uniref:alpha/beta fold hydrolase n=1 Tax=unclassified Rhizobium TaxID=2613769 RepID=UPI0006FEC2A0|nr:MULTISPECIES: alpha/beta hydrolase [unclassified Rhizobium]KQV38914.1 sigma factor sigB regulation protein rsbQ [Rhizobium sp. Root1212]KRD34982.1 sigma factor sigB regulation protein rsbQ [Rhizobium sp. Root268]
MSVINRNNVNIMGNGSKTMLFAHGFGCDQNMWRYVAPQFADRFRVVTFDHVGAGGSDLSAYDFEKYGTLDGYASDIVEIGQELAIANGIFVGHSVSAMMGVLASAKAPTMFSQLVLVGPSPRYMDDLDYHGGFSRQQVDELLDFLDSNHMGWSQAMAPAIMGNSDRPELSEELTNSFCKTDPEIAKHFARATFMADNRADLDKVRVPSLILQCAEDVIAPVAVGHYLHAKLPDSTLVMMKATGHCPNLSHPRETVEAIQAFVAGA